MSVTVRVSGVREAKARLERLGKHADNIQYAWPSVGLYLSRTMAQQFASQGARLGTPWRPLKPEYKLWKMRHGYSPRILIMTGEMRRGFVGRPMDIEEYRGNSARFGSSNQKAVWHHYGTRRHGRRVNPPRKILVATREVRGEVRNILARRLMGRA